MASTPPSVCIDHATSPFTSLPEECFEYIISLAGPKGACRIAAVSQELRSAADSDSVWEHFLPPNYSEIVSRASPPLQFATKKQLFFLLRRSQAILLDDGKLSLKLNSSGEKEYWLRANGLQISSYIPEWSSDEVEVEICGIIPARMLSPQTRYTAWLSYAPCHGYKRKLNLHPPQGSIKFVKDDGTEEEGETTDMDDIEDDLIDHHMYGGMEYDQINTEIGYCFIGEGVGYDVHVQLLETHLSLFKAMIICGFMLKPCDEPMETPSSVLTESN